jgi:hypothetical protein
MRGHAEQTLQTQIATFFGWALSGNVWWTTIGHGGGGRLRGAILKGMGLKAGVPDILILYRGHAYFLEMKKPGARPKRGGKGGISAEQIAVHAQIETAGGSVATCYSLDDVRAQLEWWQIPTRTEKPSTQRLREAGERLVL